MRLGVGGDEDVIVPELKGLETLHRLQREDRQPVTSVVEQGQRMAAGVRYLLCGHRPTLNSLD